MPKRKVAVRQLGLIRLNDHRHNYQPKRISKMAKKSTLKAA